MTALSEKYIAGFLDSDGSIQMAFRAIDRADSDPSMRRAYLSLEWSQRIDRDEVLHRIQNSVGGKITYSLDGKYTTLKLFGKPAEMLLYRLKNHLVIKRHYAEVVLELVRKPVKVDTARAYLKIQRRVAECRLPNYPSRKWLAGYFDGDGCFGVRVGKGKSSAQLTAEIVAARYDDIGVRLLHKCFGGSIHYKTIATGGEITAWTLTMPPSKVLQFVGFFGSELIVKKQQADYILSCAQVGHFRDGSNIREHMKQLKAQPHRLTGTGGVTTSSDSRTSASAD